MTREQWIIELEIPAMPIPAAMFANTIASAVHSPMIRGPIMSISGRVVISRGYLTLWITREMTPMSPQEKRNPKPMLKVSCVYFITCLKTKSWLPKDTEATRPPMIITRRCIVSSSYVSLGKSPESVIVVSTPPTPAVCTKRSSWLNIWTGGNKTTKTTDDINISMLKNFTLLRPSPNIR